MNEPTGRQWRASRDGEAVLTVIGPDAEWMVREIGETVAYREPEKATAANGYQLWGPWIEVASDA